MNNPRINVDELQKWLTLSTMYMQILNCFTNKIWKLYYYITIKIWSLKRYETGSSNKNGHIVLGNKMKLIVFFFMKTWQGFYSRKNCVKRLIFVEMEIKKHAKKKDKNPTSFPKKKKKTPYQFLVPKIHNHASKDHSTPKTKDD